jgi:hypothetical protein
MLPRQTHLPDLHGIERLAGAAFVATSEPLESGTAAQAAVSRLRIDTERVARSMQ